MSNQLYSTISPSYSNDENAITIKKIAPSNIPCESTDCNTEISIFDLPKENIEKIEKAAKVNPQKLD